MARLNLGIEDRLTVGLDTWCHGSVTSPGLDGRVIGMTTFGESAPAGELFKMFGFTTENVVNKAKELLA